MKILLDAGHTVKSGGASYLGRSEHFYTVPWVQGLLKEFNTQNPEYEVIKVPSIGLSKRIEWINDKNADYLISIHFNGCYGPETNGCETLHYPSRRSREFARHVHGAYAPVMENNDRGVKVGYYRQDPNRGVIAILKETNCRALVLEPEFIRHHSTIVGKRPEAAKAIVRGTTSFIQRARGYL